MNANELQLRECNTLVVDAEVFAVSPPLPFLVGEHYSGANPLVKEIAMLFAVTCTDRADAGNLRAETRQAHLDWANAEGSPVKMGGPLVGADDKPVGSLLIVEAQSPEHLKEVLAQDPYTRAGLFADVMSMPFKWTLHAPEGL